MNLAELAARTQVATQVAAHTSPLSRDEVEWLARAPFEHTGRLPPTPAKLVRSRLLERDKKSVQRTDVGTQVLARFRAQGWLP